MRIGRTLIAMAGAAVLLAALATSASTRNLSTSSQTLRATFATMEFASNFGTVRCELTIEGSFHERTIQKVVGTLSGFITRASIRTPCRQGEATILAEALPWHVRYAGFTGTLPAIRSVSATVVGVAFQVNETLFEITCLGRTTEANPLTITFNREGGGVVTNAVAGGTVPTTCGGNGAFNGTSSAFTVLNSTTRVTLTLI